jgi:ferritin-like metal-binding protein YciE
VSQDPRNDLEQILQDLMKDIYYAEKKLTKALGKMARKTTNPELREAFLTHQSQTEDQIQKLEEAFEIIGQKPKAKKCAAMDGLVEESEEHMEEYEKGAGLDAALIVGAQKVEHYEIASYGSMRSIAKTLGYGDAARIFEEIRDQERETDELLTQIAESVVNLEAEEEKDGEEGAGSPSQSSSSKGSGRSGSEDSDAGEDSSSAVSGNTNRAGSGNSRDENDGAGRGISATTDGNDRGEMAETGPAMGY